MKEPPVNKPIVHFGIINISAPGFTDIDSDVTGIGLYDVGADATLGLFGNVG